MRIAFVHIKNFRCLYDLEIPFENLTALVGRNGTGKSSILKAIDIFYDVTYTASIEDYCSRYTEEPIEIIITFDDFTPNEAELFGFYIDNERLTVTKRIRWIDGRGISGYYSMSRQIPEFAAIHDIDSKREIQGAIRELIATQRYEGLTGSFRSADQGLSILSQYTEEHPELTELVESTFQFMGAKNIGGGSLDNFTRFVLLPAVKEATEEVEGRTSPIGRLITTIVSTEIETREDLLEFRERINQEIRAMYSPENLGGLNEIAQGITNLLSIYAPNSEMRINWGEPNPVDVGLPPIIYSLLEDDFEGDIAYKGHGLQRALVLTLLEYMARLPSEIDMEERARVDIILALEEPEIYLHPSRCRYFATILLELSNRIEREHPQIKFQIVYSTHSPHFVGLDRFDSIRILRKVQSDERESMITVESHYTLDAAADTYARVCKRDRGEITRESFRVQTIPVMKPIVNEGFFADLIVLMEGPSDIGVLWKLQEIMGKEWNKKAISLLPAGGKSQLLKAAIVFKGLNIPTYMIFDLDAADPTTERVLRFLDQPPEYPTEFIHDTWACHEINLEDTLLSCLGEDDYRRLWIEVGTDFECNPKTIRKNEEATSKLTEICYEVGLKLETFENIVEAISDYYIEKVG